MKQLFYVFLLIPFVKTDFSFPPHFQFGVATASYQIEGGYQDDNKGVSTWDRLTNSNPSLIQDNSTGNVACDSYHKWRRDVEMVAEMGVNFYRFSISWPRLFPNGYLNVKNQAGIDYYNNLINELLLNNIQPVITLYHFDSPQIFSPLGSFTNSELVPLFADFSREVFSLFGDRVKTWITFNEPKVQCQDFLNFMGNVTDPYPTGIATYQCTHNLLLAHAEAYHIYNREFRHKQNGRIGITLNFEWDEPATNSNDDQEAAEQRRQFEFGIYAHPIYHYDYPAIVKQRILERSTAEGYPRSRLPTFTLEQKMKIHGTSDFLGLNHYSTWLVRAEPEAPIGKADYYSDMGTIRYQDPSWTESGAEWNKVVPWGLRSILVWLKKTYNNPEILITECGYPDRSGTVEDQPRIDFFQGYLNATLEALHLDDVKVTAFTAWSLMDNFEWQQGYQIKFGLFSVDFEDDTRPRTAKKSVAYFKNVVESRIIE